MSKEVQKALEQAWQVINYYERKKNDAEDDLRNEQLTKIRLENNITDYKSKIEYTKNTIGLYEEYAAASMKDKIKNALKYGFVWGIVILALSLMPGSMFGIICMIEEIFANNQNATNDALHLFIQIPKIGGLAAITATIITLLRSTIFTKPLIKNEEKTIEKYQNKIVEAETKLKEIVETIKILQRAVAEKSKKFETVLRDLNIAELQTRAAKLIHTVPIEKQEAEMSLARKNPEFKA